MVFTVASCILAAQRDETMAILAVVFYTASRVFGTGLWSGWNTLDLFDMTSAKIDIIIIISFIASKKFTERKVNSINSQAPDVPELAHPGIFQLSRLSKSCYVKTVKKYPLHFNRADFLKIMSVPQDHYFHMKVKIIFWKFYTWNFILEKIIHFIVFTYF